MSLFSATLTAARSPMVSRYVSCEEEEENDMEHFALLILQHMTSCVMCCFSSYILLLCGSSEFLFHFFLTQVVIASATPSAVENVRPYSGKLVDTRKFATLSSIYVKRGSYLLPISESQTATQMSRRLPL